MQEESGGDGIQLLDEATVDGNVMLEGAMVDKEFDKVVSIFDVTEGKCEPPMIRFGVSMVARRDI